MGGTLVQLDPNTLDPAQTLGDAGQIRRERPNLHLAWDVTGRPRASLSVWMDAPPLPDGRNAAFVGHYAAEEDDAGRQLLLAACRLAGGSGRSAVVGPINGNTWRSYRFALPGVFAEATEPPFFLEPVNPAAYPQQWTDAGFQTLATYSSAMNDDLTTVDPRTDAAVERLSAAGLTLRRIDLGRFDQEMRAVYQLCRVSFANNFLYSPISESDFVAMYEPIRTLIRPEFVTLAEQSGTLVGFMFGIPDFNQAGRGEAIDTVLAKTVAVLPGRQSAGLGSVLLDLLQRNARAAGMRRVIYALMHDGNRSKQVAARFCRPMRRYALFIRDAG